MVERATKQGLEEFVGTVVDVVLEKNDFQGQETSQYHVTMKPETVKIEGKTGCLHEWIKLSQKTTQKTVPEGSSVERYLAQIELLLPEAKKAHTLDEAFALLKGKKFLFRKVKLGRSFEGKAAKESWTPVALK